MLMYWLDQVRRRLSFTRLRKQSRRRAVRHGWSPSAGWQKTEPLEDRSLLNNAPIFDTPTYSFTVAQDTPRGDPVGTVWANDADADPLMYSLSGGSATAVFSIDPTSGTISVSDPSSLFQGTIHYLTAAVSDTIDMDSAAVSITVTSATSGGGGGATNQPPFAHAGGPYSLSVNNALSLDGSASYDPDYAPNMILTHE